MSGIAGVFRFDGQPVERGVIERMLAALKNRGPHKQDIYIEDKIALGLALLDLSPQPDGRSVAIPPNLLLPITFDGRLDNRNDLLATLKLENPLTSDTELVFAAYKKWGRDCPKFLLGDYAFALWDRRTNALFCARDHFGVKPFYYHFSNQCFIFASSPYAILAAYPELMEINDARVADFLVGFEGFDETNTFYKKIFRMPRRYAALIKVQGITIAPYWDLQPSNLEPRTEKEYIDTFQEIFHEAVRCRLGSVTNTIIPLSGGLDSTSILSSARRLFPYSKDSKDFLMTISAVAENENDTETKRIRSVIAQGGVQGNVISDEQILESNSQLVADLSNIDEPFDVMENTWRAVYGISSQQGFQISLDGVDGDVALLGRNYLNILWRQRDYKAFLKETLLAKGLDTTFIRNRFSWFLMNLRSALPPLWLKKSRHEFNIRTVISRLKKYSLINNDFARQIELIERYRQFSVHETIFENITQIEAHQRYVMIPHMQAALERYDRIAASYSIESRHPFMDVRLIEYCLSLPWQLKTYQGWTKMLLRKSMEAALPAEVVWGREKKHPAWSLGLKILRYQGVYFREILDQEKNNLEEYIDLKRLDSIWNEFYNHDIESYMSVDNRTVPIQIWDAIGLVLWLRRQRAVAF